MSILERNIRSLPREDAGQLRVGDNVGLHFVSDVSTLFVSVSIRDQTGFAEEASEECKTEPVNFQ